MELLGGSPLLRQGEMDFSPAEKRSILKRASAPGFLDNPALKRTPIRGAHKPPR